MSPGSFWFINAAAGAGGDGRLTAPFNSISAFNSTAADDPGDNIFLFSGSYPSTILLLENQRLIGQGATSTLQTITGLIPPTGSLAFPSTGGTRPTIAVGAGTGVTLASGNSVLGLNVTNSAGHGITGSAVGTLTLADFDVTVTGGSALSLTTSDTVTATGADNDLSATTGAALNVANVTIGAAGMTFKSISSSGGTNNGLTLDTTGSSGGLTVTGDGTNTSVGGNGSGGTITNKSGADGNFTNGIGIYLNSTSNVVLRRMTINGTNQNYGIRGNLVNNFTLEYSTVNGTNGTAATRPSPENYGEGSVHFGNSTTTGMTGTGTVTNCVFAGGRARNFSVVNSSGTLNRLTITGCTFGLIQNFSDANSNLACEARKGSNPTLNATVTGCSFQGQPGDAANFTGQGVTTMDVIFGGVTATRGTAPGNAITNSHAQNIIGGGSLTFATKGAMTFHCLGNTMRDAHGSAVTFFKAGKDAGDPDPSLSGFFNNHEIGVAAALDSGSKSGNGIFVSAGGTGTMSYTITNNFIHQIRGNAHIYADNTGGSYTANFTITGNTLDTPGLPTWFAGIAVTNGSPISSDTVNVCAKIGGSTAAEKNTLNLAGNLGVIVGGSGANGGHTFNLPGYAGGASEAAREANVESLLTSNNAGSFTADAYVDAPATFGGTFTGIGAG